MAVAGPLIGKSVDLRAVETDDAQFILSLRNDKSISEYLPRLNITLDEQRKWISEQRDKEGDYYFLIIDKNGNRLGTVSIYDIVDNHGENGRLACRGQAYQVMEAQYLISVFTFDTLKLDFFVSNIAVDNLSPQKIIKYFGGVIEEGLFDYKGMRTVHGITTRDGFYSNIEKYERFFKIGQ